MQYTIEDIKKEYDQNPNLDFLFFYGHKPGPNGAISNGCFSQWWPCQFEIDGVSYNCAEQYMMAEKARAFPGNETLLQNSIMIETNPAAHKKYGRMVVNYDNDIWNRIRKDVVVKGNLAKFSQNQELKDYLLATGDKILVEASPYDGIWGIKMYGNDTRAKNPHTWLGTNLLGFALMEVRDALRENNA